MTKEKDKLTEQIHIRCSPYEKNFLLGLAKMYAKGNLSLFMIYSAFNSERKFLEEDDLVESKRRTRKGRNDPSE